MFEHEARLEVRRYETEVRSGFRERVEELVRAQWREPVIVLRLGDDSPGFDVPGRRLDGTVKGKKLVRRFFWNVFRGIGGAVLALFSLANGADARGVGHLYRREIRVKGPADAMALDLLDKLRKARGSWLVFSPSCIAVVDTGSTFQDSADAPPPRIIWQARQPQAPAVSFRRSTMTWPDGSIFRFLLHGRPEEQHLRKFLEPPETIHWNGRPG
ncbi:hypothetical protein FNH05_36500 [Amycolatopsis rhizosphaerae]|uniref:Uncharacterized protein n=1 Tax=Amycolatopsis rhizosphaerae TaxID=2053003 RepID=A0A557ZXX0_9PSEU|nr:hypothetical protein [Amycolatopsis rhizosphaerae]TVT16851.1 hypothetical protein FNH05_36500 [Amycolatopsis rhizosphaerae]